MSVAVGLRVIDLERDKLALGVIEDVGVLVAVMDDVGVTLSLDVLVFDGVPELLGVAEALVPIERDADGVPVIDDVRDVVDDDVCDAVPEKDTVVEAVGVPDDEMEVVILTVDVGLDESDGVIDDDAVALADAPRESVVVGVPEADDEMLVVVDRLSLKVAAEDGVGVDVLVDDGVDELVGVTVGVEDDEIDMLRLELGVIVGDTDDDAVRLPEAPSERLADGVSDSDDDRLAVDDRLSLEEGVAEGVELLV